MNYRKDLVRIVPVKTTLLIFCACFFASLSLAQELPASLQNGPSSSWKELHIGTIDVQAEEITGIGARFTGDFRAYPPDSMDISFENCWFNPGPTDYDYTWTFASDSSWADLQIWDTNAEPYSGYGKFLNFYRAGGIGSLTLDDLLKTAPAIKVESVWTFRGSPENWSIYPNPVAVGSPVHVDGLTPGMRIEVRSTDGKTVLETKCRPGMTIDTDLHPGLYMVLYRNHEGQVAGSKKLIVR